MECARAGCRFPFTAWIGRRRVRITLPLLIEPCLPLRIVREPSGVAPPSRPSNVEATRLSKYRSCVTSTSAPGKSSRFSSRISSVGISRSFVGSSSSSTSAGSSISFAIRTRARSPPLRFLHRLVQLLAGKKKSRRPTGHVYGAALMNDPSPSGRQRAAQRQVLIQLPHLAEIDQPQRIGTADAAFGGLEFRRGADRSSVVFPLPFGPTRPTFDSRRQNKIQAARRFFAPPMSHATSVNSTSRFVFRWLAAKSMPAELTLCERPSRPAGRSSRWRYRCAPWILWCAPSVRGAAIRFPSAPGCASFPAGGSAIRDRPVAPRGTG